MDSRGCATTYDIQRRLGYKSRIQRPPSRRSFFAPVRPPDSLSTVAARVPRNRICRRHRISLSRRDIEVSVLRVRCCPGLLGPTSSLYTRSRGTVWSAETSCCVACARAALRKSNCRRNEGYDTNPSYERSCGHRLFLLIIYGKQENANSFPNVCGLSNVSMHTYVAYTALTQPPGSTAR